MRLLGGFTLERNGQPCGLAYEKGRALLAYMATESSTREFSRSHLASLLWPELDRQAALGNLRLVLHDLRRALNAPAAASPPLQIGRDFVRLDPAALLEIDIDEFSAPLPACQVSAGSANCPACLARMETLAALYRGEFLAGISLPGCKDFHEWIQVRREALRLHILQLLSRLTDCHEQAGDYVKSLPFIQHFLEMEPWNEEALRRAMRLWALAGQPAAALVAFETGSRALLEELGVAPAEETRQLAERIRRGDLTPTSRRRGDAPPERSAAAPSPEFMPATVLYCELAPADPAQAAADFLLPHEPLARLAAITRSHLGHIVPVCGGCFLAYFGYPHASEKAPWHAVMAALAMLRVPAGGLALRIGVHSGAMPAGSDHATPDANGILSRRALQLGHLAAPGEILVSAAVQLLLAGTIATTRLRSRTLPGDPAGTAIYKIVPGQAVRDLPAAAAVPAPFVGRTAELGLLDQFWQAVLRGERRSVFLRGDAGIGKSRLATAFAAALDGQGIAWQLHCHAEHAQSPFQPLAAMLGGLLGFAADDAPAARFDQLVQRCDALGLAAEPEAVPLLAGLLGLPLRAPWHAFAGTPALQRERTLALAAGLLERLAARRPVLLIAKDLQWSDPSTLEFLRLLATRPQASSLLLLMTARTGFQLAWEAAVDRRAVLAPLDEADATTLVAAVAPGLVPAAQRAVVARAAGVPLYVEKLARAVAPGTAAGIPASLQEAIEARLGGLGQARLVIQKAAAIGREFSFELLQRIAGLDADQLARLLGQCEAAGILQRLSGAAWRFNDALVREAAYQSLGQVERAATHRRIAAALEMGRDHVRPELLAQHWAAGNNHPQAIACWAEAGKLACRHSACLEALAHFRAGLDLLATQPEGAGRNRQEFELQIGLGAAATAVQGYASAEAAAAYGRAQALCARNAGMEGMFPAVWGLWASASSRSGYASALKLADKLQRMGERSGDALELQQGHFAVANTLFWQGRFAAALPHLGRIVGLYREEHHARHVALFGEDAGVTAQSYLSWVLWFLGEFDEARRASAQAIALARRREHPFSLAYALTFAALLHCRLRQPAQALALAEETLALADQHAFALWKIGATLARGWALAMQGERAGLAALQECVAGTRAAMGGVTLAVLEPIAAACLQLGEVAQANRHLAEALRVGAALGDRHVDAELHRLRGAALLGLARPRKQEAAASFRQALAISRRQHAKALELRAATGLARLLAQQGKQKEAQRLLAPLCDGFPPGGDNRDLAEASELLLSLGG